MWMGSERRCYVGRGLLYAADVMHKMICRVLVMDVLLMPRASAAESVSIKTGTVCKRLVVAV
jgi:hypothetical protein